MLALQVLFVPVDNFSAEHKSKTATINCCVHTSSKTFLAILSYCIPKKISLLHHIVLWLL